MDLHILHIVFLIVACFLFLLGAFMEFAAVPPASYRTFLSGGLAFLAASFLVG